MTAYRATRAIQITTVLSSSAATQPAALELRRLLDERCRERGISLAVAVREALCAYLGVRWEALGKKPASDDDEKTP